MAKAKLDDSIIIRTRYAEGTHPENGEKIDVSIALNGVPVITYKGHSVVYDIQEIVDEAVDLIDEMLEKKYRRKRWIGEKELYDIKSKIKRTCEKAG
ncbi:hypothetical protein AB3331_04745 [Streptococcus sp. H49]|uniref:hypothetical protein n=1 Tax=Streptococcus huangxiaojuni TaxID=3237239 RepID=UPI0034A30895